MPQMKTTIKIRKGYSPEQRKIIAEEIIDYIVKRSKSGKDKDEKSFPKYSQSYKKSKDFEIAGKKGKPVNLTLSDEMLNALKLLSHRNGEITIGFDKDDDRNNGVAEGNIKGTYGNLKPLRGKKRDFLGITASKKAEIQDKYPLKNKRKLSEAVGRFLSAQRGAEEITNE